MAQRPSVTVIIPSLTVDSELLRSMQSVYSQRSVRLQLVVISPDPGGTIPLKDWEVSDFRWIRSPAQGVYPAMNRGLEVASSEWVAFLGAGDCLSGPDVWRRMLEQANQSRSGWPQIIYGAMQSTTQAGKVRTKSFSKYAAFQCNFRMPFPHVGTLFNRKLFQEFGFFSEDFVVAADFEWLTRVVSARLATHCVSFPVVRVLRGGLSDRPSTRVTALEEESRVLRAHPHRQLSLGSLLRALKLLVNRCRLLLLVNSGRVRSRFV